MAGHFKVKVQLFIAPLSLHHICCCEFQINMQANSRDEHIQYLETLCRLSGTNLTRTRVSVANKEAFKLELWMKFQINMSMCKMGLTGLHDFYGSWHLYICLFLFAGFFDLFVASLLFMKGAWYCVIRRK